MERFMIPCMLSYYMHGDKNKTLSELQQRINDPILQYTPGAAMAKVIVEGSAYVPYKTNVINKAELSFKQALLLAFHSELIGDKKSASTKYTEMLRLMIPYHETAMLQTLGDWRIKTLQ
ncbi:MAG: hypothetical protein HRU15_20725 [Planctomycetes bacterium]|nr:hypothetical protein [Planctomycetota bacterium]